MIPQHVPHPAIQLPTRTYRSAEEWFIENTKDFSVEWHQRYFQGLKEALQNGEDVKS